MAFEVGLDSTRKYRRCFHRLGQRPGRPSRPLAASGRLIGAVETSVKRWSPSVGKQLRGP